MATHTPLSCYFLHAQLFLILLCFILSIILNTSAQEIQVAVHEYVSKLVFYAHAVHEEEEQVATVVLPGLLTDYFKSLLTDYFKKPTD